MSTDRAVTDDGHALVTGPALLVAVRHFLRAALDACGDAITDALRWRPEFQLTPP